MAVADALMEAPVDAPESKAAAQMRRHYEFAISQDLEELDSPYLVRRRIAQAVAMAGILAFLLVDYLSGGRLQSGHAPWTAQLDWKLIATVLPIVILPIAYNFRLYRKQGLGQYLLMGMFILGLGLASAMDIGRNRGSWLNFESLMLVTIYIYFVSGLTLFRAVFCGLCSWAAFTTVEISRPDGVLEMEDIAYLLVSNLVGVVGLAYLERSARERYSDHYRLQMTAMLDFLTGVLNRGAIRSHIERTWRQACREDRTYALLLVDVDRFKSLNDTHGHHVGDACLVHVAEALSTLARRPLDAVGRWGGDEFVAVWYDLDARYFSSLLKDLPVAVAAFQHPDLAGRQLPPLSITGGAVLALPGDNHRFAEVMEKADALLYKAKRDGRGQIFTALSVDANEQQAA